MLTFDFFYIFLTFFFICALFIKLFVRYFLALMNFLFNYELGICRKYLMTFIDFRGDIGETILCVCVWGLIEKCEKKFCGIRL